MIVVVQAVIGKHSTPEEGLLEKVEGARPSFFIYSVRWMDGWLAGSPM